MSLWIEVLQTVKGLRPACKRFRTYVTMTFVLCAMAMGPDLLGVSSFVRVASLKPRNYRRMLSLFNGSGIDLDRLRTLWLKWVLARFNLIQSRCGRPIFVLDGTDIAKHGRKMPARHMLHNHSDSKNLPTFYQGHSYQILCVLAQGVIARSVRAVPLLGVMDDGATFSNRDTRTKIDRGINVFLETTKALRIKAVLVADAAYCTGRAICNLADQGQVFVSRVRNNAVACEPALAPAQSRPGRPRKYGNKVRLSDEFEKDDGFVSIKRSVYGDEDITIRIKVRDLLWRPAGRVVRFVWISNPLRGNIVLMSTDICMTAEEALDIYASRFKIETALGPAKNLIGTFSYRFWMQSMTPTSKKNKGQCLHRETEEYRINYRRKLHAYALFVQLGCIAQGILQHLALHQPSSVWKGFRGWLRTMRPDQTPSELVTAAALRASFPVFLQQAREEESGENIFLEEVDFGRVDVEWCQERRCA
jgi:hypothetical protein